MSRTSKMLMSHTAHRPIALRTDGFVGRQTWVDLVFAHWELPADVIAARLPPGMTLDTHPDYPQSAWVGIVPFGMTGVRPQGLPAVWGLSRFLELNVRTYVRCNGVAGVYFFSLDADSWLGVLIARRIFSLPYYKASMRCESISQPRKRFAYQSRRRVRGGPDAIFRASFGAIGPAFTPSAGTLLSWLTERYIVFSADSRGGIWRADVHHLPWVLRDAEMEISENSLSRAAGFELAGPPNLIHFAPRTEVVVWWPERVVLRDLK